jgi:drug/metabolite transporter (DMT)-like permease
VLLSISSSLLLNEIANPQSGLTMWIILIFGLALLINVIRFGLWGWIHKSYDVSKTYPLVSLFFPCIYVISVFLGESDWNLQKIAGVSFIVIGIVIFERSQKVTTT